MLRDNLRTGLIRLPHLDALRLLAIFLVIFNHTGNNGYTLFIERIDSPASAFYMAASVFCKIAVPLFFMISGALLLKKEESLKQLFCKRILRMVLVLVLISIPFYYWLQKENGIGIDSFFGFIYSESASTSLWYLYSYIALLLVMPFLRAMVKNLRHRDYIYLFFGYLTFTGVLPCVELIFGLQSLHNELSPVFFMTQNVFYALMGHYMENVFYTHRYTKKNAALWLLMSFIAVMLTVALTYVHIEGASAVTTEQAERFFNCFIFIPAVGVYFLVKYLFTKVKSQRFTAFISRLGSTVFGVYLIEKFLRAALSPIYNIMNPIVGSFVASLSWCLGVFVVGTALILALKSIPGLKRIVNKFI